MHPYYITTPIYYVNDRPHIGHCYTTLLADVAARFQRLLRGSGVGGKGGSENGDRGEGGVFLLTGTDEHAEKVVSSAHEHGVTPIEWADRNAAAFRAAFEFMGFGYEDFIRTTERRHIDKVLEYVRRLQKHGDIYLGDYTGWWDASQEEYVTESVAKEAGYNSPVTGKPLVKRTEKNYFFRLSAYAARLEEHIAKHPAFIQPEARRNEVLGRLRAGLQDVPVSRAVTGDEASRWGILMPDDPSHRIYVWIDALFNYLSAVDTPGREGLWPPAVHVMAKDILWFHAVIWPCMLMALGRELPGMVYAHSYWVREGRKMSKTLGNFVDLPTLRAYAERYSVDAVRWYMLTQGPLGITDADFSHAKFVEVYNADLANGIGNCTSRVSALITKSFGGIVPDPGEFRVLADHDWPTIARNAVLGESAVSNDGVPMLLNRFDLAGAVAEGVNLVRCVDAYLSETTPWKLAKEVEKENRENPDHLQRLAAILYHCAEALRIASILLAPAMPGKMAELWTRWGCTPAAGATLEDLAVWQGEHSLKPGERLEQGGGSGAAPLFMRADVKEGAPVVG
ncbi:MAG: methionine--tRNA ligase [Phycisphaeraceae bacterium]|nr:methionine--tRNA ligase [Phycisphaeraceae bacterium]